MAEPRKNLSEKVTSENLPKESGIPALGTQGPNGGDTSRIAGSQPVEHSPIVTLPPQIGRYRIERLLGAGAMGTVYLATDTQLDRSVALKIPKVSGSKTLLKRMQAEARVLAKLDHPNLCKVYDFDTIDGIRFIAMEFVEGEDLKSIFQRLGKKQKPTLAVQIIMHLAKGLGTAHEKGIIHRDLKPENVMRKKDGRLVIMDFGLARQTQVDANAERTQGGVVMGSAAYMSPEQASGLANEIDLRSDIYALGVMLFEMLTGEWPFRGNSIQIMGQKATQPPPSPLEVDPGLPPQLAEVCQKLLAKNKEDRYQSCAEVVQALKKVNLEAGASGTGGGSSQEAATLIDQSPFGFEFLQDEVAVSPATKSFARRRSSASDPGLRKKQGGWRDLPPPLKILLSCVPPLAAILLGVLFLQTEYGMLKINIDDPSLAVRIDHQTVTFEHSGQSIKVSPTAKHTLQVQQNGVTVDGGMREISLSQGEQRLITISLIQGTVAIDGKPVVEQPHSPPEPSAQVPAANTSMTPPSSPPPAADDLERQAAEYVISIGGSVQIAESGQVITSVSRLPGTKFSISAIRFFENRNIDAEGFSRLAHCRHVTELSLLGCEVSDDALSHLKNWTELESIEMTGAQIAGNSLRHFYNCKSLRNLMLWQVPCTDADVLPFKGLDLKHVNLGGTRVTDAALKIVDDCPDLDHLNVSYTSVGDAGLAHAIHCKKLQSLLICSLKVSSDGIRPFQSFPQLWRLDARSTNLTDADIRPFLQMKKLKWLDLEGSPISIDFVKEVKAALPECRVVGFESVMPAPAATPATPEKDEKAHVFTDREVAEWVHSIGGTVFVSNPDDTLFYKNFRIIPAEQQLPEPFVIIGINLSKNSKVRSADLDRLIFLKRLETLYLSETSLDSSAVNRLKKLTHLDFLGIGHTGISGNEIQELESLPYLTYLSLDHSQLVKLENPGGFVNVTALSIDDAEDVDLGKIGGFPALRTVFVHSHAPLNVAEVTKAQMKNQRLRIHWFGNKQDQPLGRNPQNEASAFLADAGFQLIGHLGVGQSTRLSTSQEVKANPGKITTVIVDRKIILNNRVLMALNSMEPMSAFEARGNRQPNRLVSALKGQSNLNRIDLFESDLEDAHLESISSLFKLKELDVRETKVTQKGLARLHCSLPRCQITSNFGIIAPDFDMEPCSWKDAALPASAATSATPEKDEKIHVFTDREVAEWVHSIGGGVSVSSPDPDSLINGQKSLRVPAGQPLPESFVVISIDLYNNTQVQNADLDRLASLKRLIQLHLSGTKLDTHAVERLKKLTYLKYLSIANTAIPGSELESLASLPFLSDLTMDHSQLMALENPDKFLNLYQLDIRDAKDVDLRKIAGFPNLRAVYFLSSSPLNETEVAKLQSKNQRLRVYWQVKDNQFKHIGNDPGREAGVFLAEAGIQLMGGQFGEAARLLTSMDIQNGIYASKIIVNQHTRLNAQVFMAISRMSYFSEFEARSNRLPGRLLKSLKGQAYLYKLDLTGSMLGDEDLEEMPGIFNLRTVDISKTKVTQAGVAALHRCLPRCRIVSDVGTIEPDYDAEPGSWKQ